MTAVARVETEPRRVGIATVAVVGAAQILSIALGLGAPLQPFLSVLFVLTCPGFLLMDMSAPRDFSARLMIAIAGSLSINIAIATLVLVAEARWIAPLVALSLVAVAALPGERLRKAMDRVTSLVGPKTRPQLALPAGKPEIEVIEEDPVAAAASEQTQVGMTVGVGEVPELASLEVPVLDVATAAPALVDINTADAEALMALPGVGPTLAARIVEFRTKQGPFERFDDLLLVPGIGPAKISGLPDVATLRSDEPAAETAGPQPLGDDEHATAAEPRASGGEPTGEPAASTAGATPPNESLGVDDMTSAEADAEPARAEQPGAESPETEIQGDAAAEEVAAADAPTAEEDQEETAQLVLDGTTGGAIDVNVARASELADLPGIGRALAGRIVAHRTLYGPFRSTADLEAVDGMGKAKVAGVAELVKFTVPLIDVNSASSRILAAVPGVGRALARRIVDHRNDNGPFADLDDLTDVSGIGPAKLDELRRSLTV